MKVILFPAALLAAQILGLAATIAAELPNSGKPVAKSQARTAVDLVFKTVGGQPLKLDLYLPEKHSTSSPLVIWIHGGGWREGTKSGVPILPFLASGFAVASIEYRLSGQAPFPAQIEDVKAAIRWLRAHANDYGLAAEHFGVIGHSAGAHLASLAGTTGKGSPFDLGDNLEFSSAVQAVCVMSGPSDFVTMFDGADEHRRSALVGLLGGSLPEKRKLAEAASPLSYVQPGLLPFILVHGADDRVVPVQQAKSMNRKLEEVGATPRIILLPQTGHDVFARQQQYVDEVRAFFKANLAKK
ncbi:MAG: alpha/beta hydrolase [Opitutaceae bacterium]|nr:alpha/beta hydrolase [Verrucomicrobiales bacterium]